MLQVQEIELTRLHPWEGNPRLNDHAVAAVAESIKSFGFNVPILCDQNLTIVAGHTRWKAAQKLGMTRVPVIVVEMTDVQRRAFSVADNKTAEVADWDFPKLREVLEELRSEDVDIKSLGFSDGEIRRLLLDHDADEDAVPSVSNLSPSTQFGDLYVLGNHRLLCGDSRDRESLMLLTDGHVMDHVCGGPPYFNQRAYSHWDEYQAYLQDMRRIIENCRDVLKDGGVCVWNIANGCSSHHNHVSHHSRYHTDVWEIPAVTNQMEQFGHPAVCPVEIPYRSIQAYTGSRASVFEPFGGSGTTLIAAEKASRKAYVIEAQPAYCDVIIKRWETLTGGKAIRVAGSEDRVHNET